MGSLLIDSLVAWDTRTCLDVTGRVNRVKCKKGLGPVLIKEKVAEKPQQPGCEIDIDLSLAEQDLQTSTLFR